MSNSGTLRSCFADFIRLPMPALRAIRSFSSFTSSVPLVTGTSGLLSGEPRVGDAGRVGGNESMCMSIMMDERRRRAGSSAKRVVIGLGGRRMVVLVGSCTTTEGLSNDQVLTRSNARA